MGLVDTGRARPPASLHGMRHDSAKALLLVVLGEFVWPRPSPVWSSVLLAALAELDVEPNAARKALTRTAESGLIQAHRDGRRVRWSLSERGHAVMSAGYRRAYGWRARDTTWDGRWLLLSVSLPEAQRNLRNRLQSRLIWAGLGSPVPGQWLTPHADRADDVAAIVARLGVAEQSHAIVGPIGPVGDEARLVEAAWDLRTLGAEYAEFVAEWTDARPDGPASRFRARVAMVQAWRRFPYIDPDLPARFLPAGWPGSEATRVFHARYEEWAADAERHWQTVER